MAPPRVAFLTGQSDPQRCALSPQQQGFLDGLPLPAGIERVRQNFPWDAHTAPWRPTSLLRASWANWRQYRAARTGRMPTSVVAHAHAWLQRAPRTLLLVGSCGLQLLDALLADGPLATRAPLRVVAYGAVGRRWPAGIDGAHLRGRRDWVAACAPPRGAPPALAVDCDHLNYLRHPALRDAVLAQLPWLASGADEPRA
jgi:hypothetical protein